MSNTNEELAIRIQQGETALYGELWGQTKYFLIKMVNSYYKRNEELLTRHGLTLDDLHQTAFLALVFAVKSYDPGKGIKLTTYFNFALKNEIQAALGGGSRRKIDTLNTCDSLDRPVGEDGDASLGDFVPDPNAAEELQDIEEEISRQQDARVLWDFVEHLPEDHGAIIMDRYKNDLTFDQIGQKYGISRYKARAHHERALRHLIYNKRLKAYLPEKLLFRPFFIVMAIPFRCASRHKTA